MPVFHYSPCSQKVPAFGCSPKAQSRSPRFVIHQKLRFCCSQGTGWRSYWRRRLTSTRGLTTLCWWMCLAPRQYATGVCRTQSTGRATPTTRPPPSSLPCTARTSLSPTTCCSGGLTPTCPTPKRSHPSCMPWNWWVTLACCKYTFDNNNNNRLFMAPHLVRAQSAYKDIRICSFHHTHIHACMHIHKYTHTYTHTHTHTHTHHYKYMHYWWWGWYSEKKTTAQYTEVFTHVIDSGWALVHASVIAIGS